MMGQFYQALALRAIQAIFVGKHDENKENQTHHTIITEKSSDVCSNTIDQQQCEVIMNVNVYLSKIKQVILLDVAFY